MAKTDDPEPTAPELDPPRYDDIDDGHYNDIESHGVEMMPLVPPANRECRICFEKGSESGRMFDLVAPCLCKGTSQWVHRTCLDHWRATSTKSFMFCRECGFEYRLSHDASEARFTKSRFRLLIARDFSAALAVLIGVLACVAFTIAWFDGARRAPRLLAGVAEYYFSVYFVVATIGSLALLGFASSCYQLYSWYVLQEPITIVDWQACCCMRCCDCRYMSFWDWYWCMHLFENCMRSARHGMGSVRREDMHIAAIAALIALVIFAVIGTFVGGYFAMALGQVILNNHGQLLRRRVLTKEYRVEDLDGIDIQKLPPREVSVAEDDLELIGHQSRAQ